MRRDDRTNKAGEARGRGDASRGFTLVELLVVMVILGILVALVVGAARSITLEMGRRRTESIQKILVQAIHEYRDAREKDPAPPPSTALSPGDVYTGNSGSSAAAVRISSLHEQLSAEPKSVPYLQKLPREAIYTPTQQFRGAVGKYKTIRDGFDFDMDFIVTGLGPVILSVGPDRQWGSNDDVRSDRGGQ